MEATRKLVCLETFGCQMNVLDGELALSEFRKQGWETTQDPAAADLVVFATCSVREHAEARVLSRLGRLKRRKERDAGFRVAVMGCMAQRQGEDLIRRAGHVDVVCGSQEFLRLPDLLREAERTGRPVVALRQDGVSRTVRDLSVRPRRHQAFVAVMRGCRHRCSYCIVPRVRGGRETSRPVAEIVAEARSLAEDGVREITLLGQNINSYGRSLPDRPRLPAVLRALEQIDGIDRVRFVTSNPTDLDGELIEAVGELPKVMEYLHVPAQSGSDRILRRMARGYTRERYVQLVDLVREKVPGVQIASDFIVGFPGETEEDFLDTVGLMERVRFQGSFIFKYSPRPGTAADRWPDDVPIETKRARNHRLLDVQERHSLALNQLRIGRRLEVLVEGPSPRDSSRLTGRTRSNQIVVFPGRASLAGRLVDVEIHRVTALTLIGEIREGVGAG